jgi:hypothetical protein
LAHPVPRRERLANSGLKTMPNIPGIWGEINVMKL